MQDGETNIGEIKRHPIGLVSVYAGALFFIIALGVLILFGLPAIGLGGNTAIMQAAGLVGILLALLAIIFLYISVKIYTSNRWIITSDSITQLKQTSLFSTANGQLSMANLENVVVEQKGVMSHMFGYGLLKCETAGEHANYQFPYCPNPNSYAQLIIDAHERFEQELSQRQRVNSSY